MKGQWRASITTLPKYIFLIFPLVKMAASQFFSEEYFKPEFCMEKMLPI